jgi:WD40 repeat protein
MAQVFSHQVQYLASLQAHEERCTDVQWHPQALCADEDGTLRGPDHLCFATASADNTAKLWNLEGTCLQTLSGHTRRLGRIAFHPSGGLHRAVSLWFLLFLPDNMQHFISHIKLQGAHDMCILLGTAMWVSHTQSMPLALCFAVLIEPWEEPSGFSVLLCQRNALVNCHVVSVFD